MEETEIKIANLTVPGEEIRMINYFEELINNQHKIVILYVAKQGEILKTFKKKENFSKIQMKVNQQCILN